jgi:hypothetical protein
VARSRLLGIQLTLGRLRVKIIAVDLGIVAIMGVRVPGSCLVVGQ